MGESTINGSFSIAIWSYQRVCMYIYIYIHTQETVVRPVICFNLAIVPRQSSPFTCWHMRLVPLVPLPWRPQRDPVFIRRDRGWRCSPVLLVMSIHRCPFAGDWWTWAGRRLPQETQRLVAVWSGGDVVIFTSAKNDRVSVSLKKCGAP